jgi:tRNA threonylcarbamoyladenosine biosynthesis protein TsaB
MILLALECSSDDRSIAVARDRRILAAETLRGGRATPLLGMIDRVLTAEGISRAQVSGIVVGLGPGSYTGIRGALAVAQGWNLATEVPVRGLDSAAACARRAWSEGVRGEVWILIDAQRGEFYLSNAQLDDTGVTPISPLRLATSGEVDALAQAGAQLVGPAAGLGNLPGHCLRPDAPSLLAAYLDQPAPGPPPLEPLEPVYLRPIAFVKAPPARTDLPPPASAGTSG